MCGVLGTDASARISQQLTKMGRAGDRHLSYLPLAHIYERVTLIGVTHGGVSVGFYRCVAISRHSEVLPAHSVLSSAGPEHP